MLAVVDAKLRMLIGVLTFRTLNVAVKNDPSTWAG